MGRLDGKVAVITGGARGQGADEGRLFAAEGATVVLTDVRDDEGGRTAAELGVEYLHLDVTSEAEWQGVVDDVVARHGGIDVLVNHAGIWLGSKIVNTDVDQYMRLIDINQTGVFLGMRTVAAPMSAAGRGSIVNISSVAGHIGGPSQVAYSASKFAVRGMTKIAAKELGRYGVRVNSIHPGFIETEMLAELPAMQRGDQRRMLRAVPLGRMGESRDIANLALFLASEESGYCTGQEFVCDGGMLP
ncbi:MAG: glucose 1-dehydrogenase [Acidimicrobiia bacterium]|nr:glucose 1-dehydrogenase [Acidimicrobiia bacterium]